MKKNLTYILLPFVLLISMSSSAQNANSNATQQVQLNMAAAIELTFSDNNANTANTMNFNFNTITDLLYGVQSPEQEIKVRSNKAFKVDVKTNSIFFTYTGSAITTPLLSILNGLKIQVTENNTGGTATLNSWLNFNALPIISFPLLNNCNPGGDQRFKVRYKAIPGGVFPAGTYTTDVVYTATQL